MSCTLEGHQDLVQEVGKGSQEEGIISSKHQVSERRVGPGRTEGLRPELWVQETGWKGAQRLGPEGERQASSGGE